MTGFPSSNEIMRHHKAQARDATETTGTIIDSSQVTEHCGVNWLTLNSQALVAHLLYAGALSAYPSKPRNKSVSVTMMQNEIEHFDCLAASNMATARFHINPFVHVNDYKLLVPTNRHIILIYCTLCGCYLFRPVAIRKLTTK